MKYTIGIRLSDEDEAMGTDLAQHGVQLPYVPYNYAPQIDELIKEHENTKLEKKKLLYSDNYFYDFNEENIWADTFDTMEELERVITIIRITLLRHSSNDYEIFLMINVIIIQG